jgi:hypothetical protein
MVAEDFCDVTARCLVEGVLNVEFDEDELVAVALTIVAVVVQVTQMLPALMDDLGAAVCFAYRVLFRGEAGVIAFACY